MNYYDEIKIFLLTMKLINKLRIITRTGMI